jgi:protein SCO1/2
VAVVTFIFTTCSDTCPLLTAKLVGIQRKLAPGDPVFFVEITVDPLNDSPAVLKKYAEAFAAPPSHFAFLTGDFNEIHKVVRSYGVYYSQKEKGSIDHTFLTSIVDPSGTLRVQYLGSRFDPNEFLGDLRSLLEEVRGK